MEEKVVFHSLQDLAQLYSFQETGDAKSDPPKELMFSSGKVSNFIPLTPVYGTRTVQGIRISTPLGIKKAVQFILWQGMYGNKFRIVHIYFLFNLLNSYKIVSPFAKNVFRFLMVINHINRAQARSCNGNWNFCLTSLRRFRGTHPDYNEAFEQLRDYFNSVQNYSLPKKESEFEKDCFITEKSVRIQNPCPEPARIGVGYKDKGHLPEPGSEYDPDEITPYSTPSSENCWNLLNEDWREWKRTFLPKLQTERQRVQDS